MDVQSKERLTGAVILVVLIVLVVPELLRGPRGTAEPVDTSAEGPPTRMYTIELGDRATTRPAQPRTPAASRPQQSEAAPRTPQSENDTVESLPVPASAPVSESPTETRPERRTVGPSAPERSPPPETRASAGEAPVAKGWSVQVGSFAIRENAEREVGTLRKQGFSSFLTEGTASGGKRLYHVRVGPEAERAGAQALAERLRSSGRTRFFVVPYP